MSLNENLPNDTAARSCETCGLLDNGCPSCDNFHWNNWTPRNPDKLPDGTVMLWTCGNPGARTYMCSECRYLGTDIAGDAERCYCPEPAGFRIPTDNGQGWPEGTPVPFKY